MESPNFNEIIQKLEDELGQLKQETQDFVLLTEKAIGLCDRAIGDMRNIVVADGFSNHDDEIYFFRHIKPRVSSKVIFYTELFNIEAHRPKGDKEVQIEYLRNASQRFCKYFKKNKEFYQYYKRGVTISDHLYFVRGSAEYRIHVDSIFNHIDPKFSTGYEVTLSRFMAYEQLTKYTSKEIDKLNNQVSLNSDTEWTGLTVDATELIYALVSLGVINHGKIGIKELARLFEKMFNIELDEIYRIFQDIQKRTTVRTKFLDQLKEALLKRIDNLNK
jgi:hypothetical protein